MKKIYYLLFVLLIGFLLVPNVFAKDSVEITSITLDSKSDNTVINADPTFNGLEMNYDVAFKAKDDYAKYKVVIKNNTNTTYKISNDTSFNDSEYITYKYDVTDELKGKGEVIVYVTITYNKEVAAEQLVDGKYTEANRAVVQLLNENNELVNPDTIHNLLLVLLLLVFITGIIVLLILSKKKKLAKNVTMLLILGFGIIPTMVFAVETLKLTINVNVEIENGYSVGYLILNSYFYTDEELATDYKKTESSECVIYYINDVKYNDCNMIIYKDPKMYVPGTTANLNNVKLKYYHTKNYNYSTHQYDNICTLQDDESYLCDSETVSQQEATLYEWLYSNDKSEYGYTHSNNDKAIMNFSNIHSDNWQYYGYVFVDSPQTFTMPNHDVLFEHSMRK